MELVGFSATIILSIPPVLGAAVAGGVVVAGAVVAGAVVAVEVAGVVVDSPQPMIMNETTMMIVINNIMDFLTAFFSFPVIQTPLTFYR
jgi:hypothetical protein